MKKSILTLLATPFFLIMNACSPDNSDDGEGNLLSVNRVNYQYAETIRNASNYIALGGENQWAHFREMSPVGNTAPTIRMNFDTLYSVAVLDNTTGQITVTIPDSDTFQSILVLDDQAYSKHYFQQSGIHKIVSNSPFIILIARTGVKDRYNPDHISNAHKEQDHLLISGQGNKPFSPTLYDQKSLESLTDELQKEFLDGDGVLVYGQFENDVDEDKRLLSNAAGWGGMHDNINMYTSSTTMSGDVCRAVSFPDPQVGEFFSFTMYDEAGYLMDGNTAINSYNMLKNADDSYTISFNCGDAAVNNITSTGRDFNYIVRTYVASQSVKSGEWNPVSPAIMVPTVH